MYLMAAFYQAALPAVRCPLLSWAFLTGLAYGFRRSAGCGYSGTRVLTSIRSGWCLTDTEEELQFAADLEERQ